MLAIRARPCPGRTCSRRCSSGRSGSGPRHTCCRYYRRRHTHDMERVVLPSTTCRHRKCHTNAARLRKPSRRRKDRTPCAPGSRPCPRHTCGRRLLLSNIYPGRIRRSQCGTGCSNSPRYISCRITRPATTRLRRRSRTSCAGRLTLYQGDMPSTQLPSSKYTPASKVDSPCDLRRRRRRRDTVSDGVDEKTTRRSPRRSRGREIRFSHGNSPEFDVWPAGHCSQDPQPDWLKCPAAHCVQAGPPGENCPAGHVPHLSSQSMDQHPKISQNVLILQSW